MNTQIEQISREIAFEIYAIRPSDEWTKAVFLFQNITCMSEAMCTFFLGDKVKKSSMPKPIVANKFTELRTKMAEIHQNKQTWYTATCTVTPDGKFKFDFDYDHLPAFEIIPSASKWLDEFKTYPRPELQEKIQDWIDGKVKSGEIVQRLIKLQQD